MYSCTFIGHSSCDPQIKTKLYSTIEKLINIGKFDLNDI